MSKNSNVVVLSAKAQKVYDQLKSIRGIDVTVNVRSFWVKAPKTGKTADALKGMGFKFAESKGEWWFTHDGGTKVQVQAQTQTKTAPKGQKAQPKKAVTPKAEKAQPKAEKKAERKFEELPEDTKAQVRAYVERTLPGVTVRFKGEWVYLGGETKQNYDAIKPIGLFWGAKLQEWCGPAEKLLTYASASADATPAKAQPAKAEPKAQKPRTRKGTGKVSQPTMAGLFA